MCFFLFYSPFPKRKDEKQTNNPKATLVVFVTHNFSEEEKEEEKKMNASPSVVSSLHSSSASNSCFLTVVLGFTAVTALIVAVYTLASDFSRFDTVDSSPSRSVAGQDDGENEEMIETGSLTTTATTPNNIASTISTPDGKMLKELTQPHYLPVKFTNTTGTFDHANAATVPGYSSAVRVYPSISEDMAESMPHRMHQGTSASPRDPNGSIYDSDSALVGYPSYAPFK